MQILKKKNQNSVFYGSDSAAALRMLMASSHVAFLFAIELLCKMEVSLISDSKLLLFYLLFK